MASQGFIVNDAVVTAIGNTYKSALLHEDATIDAASTNGALPSASMWSNLELIYDLTAGGPVTEITVKITWDSAGDVLAVDEQILSTSDGSLVAGQTDTSLLLASVTLDTAKRAPAGQTTAGKVYLWSKVSDGAGGTIKLNVGRLNWYVPSYGAR